MPRTVQQSVVLAAPPEALYAMYLDPARHGAITGGPVRIAERPGAEFWGFDGMIHGQVLALTPHRQIVQTWRARHWAPEDLDSTLILTFWPASGGGRIDLTHVNVADHDYEGVKEGWEKYYWIPWRAYLSASK